MNAVLGIVFVALAAWGAQRLVPASIDDRFARGLAAATLFVALFVGAFLLQGYAELVIRRPVISLPVAATIVFAVCAATFASGRGRTVARAASTDDVRSRASVVRWRPVPAVAALVVAGVFVVSAALLLGGFPRGYEVRAYHLPIAVRVLRDGTLGIWDASFMHAYPVNMSLWAGLFLHVVPERFVSIVDLPFLALLLAASFGLCRSAGADRSAALLVAAGAATIPIVAFSALEIGADVAGVAFVAVATYMIATRPGSPTASATIAGIAAGLAYGFKSLHLVPLGALGLVMIVDAAMRVRGTRRSGRPVGLEAALPLVAFTASALAMMSFWLVRNLVEVGNPLYPVHLPGFDLLGWRAAPDFDLATRGSNEREWVDASWKWLVYPWVEGHFIGQNFKHSSGLGAFFAAVLPGVLQWPLYALLTWRRRRFGLPVAMRTQAIVLFVAVVVCAAWALLGDRQPRYVLAAVVLVLPIAAWQISQTTGRGRTAYEALLAVCIATMAFVLVARMAAVNGATLLQNAHATRSQWLEYPDAIDRLPAGAVVANGVDREINYALLGDGFRNRVVDEAQVERTFGAEDGRLRLAAKAVSASGITHLYVQSSRRLVTDDCVRLREVGRLDRNPFNGRPLELARIVYAVDVVCSGATR